MAGALGGTKGLQGAESALIGRYQSDGYGSKPKVLGVLTRVPEFCFF